MELTCPLDFRYGREEMKRALSGDRRLRMCLKVEASLARAHARVGNIPEAAAREITRKATLEYVKPQRVDEIEAEIRHDLMAMVKALAEQCDPVSGGYVHFGATSYDIIDTALALEMKEALEILRVGLHDLEVTLADLAMDEKDTVMVGRTHGQYAIPLSFGLKIAVFAMEVHRHIERLDQLLPRVAVGKMSGAVGSMAALGPDAMVIQDEVMKDLGLGVELAATQMVQRDRHIELVSLLANVATSMEKFATEVRNLQRSDISEVSEAFDIGKQVGSSTMANKRNPITSENVCGLARVVRGFVLPAWDNAIQWHERDLANSSSERFIIPHMFILTDECVHKMDDVFTNLSVHRERMLENLERAKGLVMAESVIMALVNSGSMGRQEAHELLRVASMKALEMDVHLKEILTDIPAVTDALTGVELDRAMDPANYIGKASDIVERVHTIVHQNG